MGKQLIYTLTINFEDKIDNDDEVLEVGRNILLAIKNEVNNGWGIAPESSETFTNSISIKPNFIDEVLTEKLF
jgi:hypothetical protein